MTALYLLADEYRAAAAQLADMDLDPQTVADTLEGLGGELEIKAQNVALMARALEADAAAINGWIKEASKRAEALERRAEHLREYLARALKACGIQKVSGPGVEISFRKSSAVVIDEPALIPADYWRTPEPPPAAPDKKLIAAALKDGAAIPGAHIETRQNIQIK